MWWVGGWGGVVGNSHSHQEASIARRRAARLQRVFDAGTGRGVAPASGAGHGAERAARCGSDGVAMWGGRVQGPERARVSRAATPRRR